MGGPLTAKHSSSRLPPLMHAGFSIVVAAGGYSLVAEHRLLTVEAWWHGL